MPQQIDTTHVIIEDELIVYRRSNSKLWQCRFQIDRNWSRKSTGEKDLAKAKVKAKELFYEAQALNRLGHPAITRKFRDVAKLAIKRLEDEAANNRGLRKHKDYKSVIDKYLVPFFGKHNVSNIDYELLEKFDAWRAKEMGKKPSKSTLQTHNAALNRVFDEAIARKFLTDSTRPSLRSDSGNVNSRRPAFEEWEIKKLLSNFDAWIAKKKRKRSKELALLLKDYVYVLLDTGARPGDELMNLKWNQIDLVRDSIDLGETTDKNEDGTQAIDEKTGEPIREVKLIRECWLTVSGKTGTRTILGNGLSIKAFERIADRNFDVKKKGLFWLEKFVTPKRDNYVFRLKDGTKPTSFDKLFSKYLDDIDILYDVKSDDKHVFYSLRHTYATLRLTHEGTAIHTLAKHMGTSVLMIEQHYSHLKVKEAKQQLRGEKVAALLRGHANLTDES